MGAFVGNDSRELSLNVNLALENSVGRKYEQSEEAAFVYSVPKCVALLSDEHT